MAKSANKKLTANTLIEHIIHDELTKSERPLHQLPNRKIKKYEVYSGLISAGDKNGDIEHTHNASYVVYIVLGYINQIGLVTYEAGTQKGFFFVLCTDTKSKTMSVYVQPTAINDAEIDPIQEISPVSKKKLDLLKNRDLEYALSNDQCDYAHSHVELISKNGKDMMVQFGIYKDLVKGLDRFFMVKEYPITGVSLDWFDPTRRKAQDTYKLQTVREGTKNVDIVVQTSGYTQHKEYKLPEAWHFSTEHKDTIFSEFADSDPSDFLVPTKRIYVEKDWENGKLQFQFTDFKRFLSWTPTFVQTKKKNSDEWLPSKHPELLSVNRPTLRRNTTDAIRLTEIFGMLLDENEEQGRNNLNIPCPEDVVFDTVFFDNGSMGQIQNVLSTEYKHLLGGILHKRTGTEKSGVIDTALKLSTNINILSYEPPFETQPKLMAKFIQPSDTVSSKHVSFVIMLMSCYKRRKVIHLLKRPSAKEKYSRQAPVTAHITNTTMPQCLNPET